MNRARRRPRDNRCQAPSVTRDNRCQAPSVTGRGQTRALAIPLLLMLASSALAVVHLRPAGPVRAAGATFVVDTATDPTAFHDHDGSPLTPDRPRADAAPGDGVCNIFADMSGGGSGVAAPPVCTLRAALEEANAWPGHDRIEFAIPGAGPHRIAPVAAFDLVVGTGGVTIDGYTQPGASPNTLDHGSDAALMIEVAGAGPTSFDGIDLRSSDNVITGLAIFGFQRSVRMWGSGSTDNRVVGNFIGTDAAGTQMHTTRVSGASGVQIEQGASSNVIGAPGNANRNVISGNADKGVALYDIGTSDNTIRNNVIGLGPDGSRLRNWAHGIDVNVGASDTLIGGLGTGDGNVISGNALSGVEISHDPPSGGSTTDNDVIGNLIGTDLTGAAAPVAMRNEQFGVNIEGNELCVSVCPPDVAHTVIRGNVIVGSVAGVMIWKGAHDHLVVGNVIGVLADGSVPASAGATIWGVLIEAGAHDNVVVDNEIAAVANGIQVRPINDYACPPSNPTCPGHDSEFPTFGNTISRNSIHDIAPGLGIDVWPLGVNDLPSELDPDVQGGVAVPTIVAVSEDAASVSACPVCTIEMFTTDAGPSAYGQGRAFVATAVADAAGVATIVFRPSPSDPLVVVAGELVAVTATDDDGNTSEFSRRVVVASATAAVSGPARVGSPPANRCGAAC